MPSYCHCVPIRKHAFRSFQICKPGETVKISEEESRKTEETLASNEHKDTVASDEHDANSSLIVWLLIVFKILISSSLLTTSSHFTHSTKLHFIYICKYICISLRLYAYHYTPDLFLVNKRSFFSLKISLYIFRFESFFFLV